MRTGLVLSIVVLAAGLAVALAGAISFNSDERGPDVTSPSTPFFSGSDTLEPTSRFLISVGPDDPSLAPTQGPTDPLPLATVYLTVTVTDPGLVGGNPAPASQLIAAPPVAAPTTFVIATESGGSGAAIISMAGGVLVSLIGAGSALWVARMQRRRSDDDDDSPVGGNYRPAASLYPNGSGNQLATPASSQQPVNSASSSTAVSSADPQQSESR